MRTITRQRGFSLIEITIVLALGIAATVVMLSAASQVSAEEEATRVANQILLITTASSELFPGITNRFPASLGVAIEEAGKMPPGIWDSATDRLTIAYMDNTNLGWLVATGSGPSANSAGVFLLEATQITNDYRRFCVQLVSKLFPHMSTIVVGGQLIKANIASSAPSAATALAACSSPGITQMVFL